MIVYILQKLRSSQRKFVQLGLISGMKWWIKLSPYGHVREWHHTECFSLMNQLGGRCDKTLKTELELITLNALFSLRMTFWTIAYHEESVLRCMFIF